MPELLITLRLACILSFSWLLVRLTRSGVGWTTVPFFSTLCVLIVVNSIVWTPQRNAWFFIIEPAFLSLQTCAVIETLMFVLRLIPRREGRSLTALLACLGVVGASVVYGVFDTTTTMNTYRTVRLEVHTALSMATVFGLAAMTIKPAPLLRFERRHAAILTVYLLKFTAIELAWGRDTSIGVSYNVQQVVSMCWSVGCAAAWVHTLLPSSLPRSDRPGADGSGS